MTEQVKTPDPLPLSDEDPDTLPPEIADPVQYEVPLAALAGAIPPAPAWYRDAMDTPCERQELDVEGASIEMMSWGVRGNPGVLLIHGARAHAQWWGPIAPMLATRYRVAAFSWSGMGGSSKRAAYSVKQTAREALAVARAAGLFDSEARPVVVGHSFGGHSTAHLAADIGEQLDGAIIIDSLLRHRPPAGAFARPHKVYPTLAEALARFRFAPPQPPANLFIVDGLARAALKQVEGGWTWRFDPDFSAKLDFASGWDALPHARCPLAFINGARSVILSPERLRVLSAQAPEGSIFLDIADAHHHVMVDQPIALLTAIEALVEGWRSRPR